MSTLDPKPGERIVHVRVDDHTVSTESGRRKNDYCSARVVPSLVARDSGSACQLADIGRWLRSPLAGRRRGSELCRAASRCASTRSAEPCSIAFRWQIGGPYATEVVKARIDHEPRRPGTSSRWPSSRNRAASTTPR
jgi:hypothetical protein